MAKQPKINGGFIVIPKNTMKSAQWKELDVYNRSVYMAILSEFIRDRRINPEHTVKITHQQIEEKANVSHGQVVKSMRILKEKEFIFVEKQGGLYGKQNYSTYKLNERFLY